MRFIENGADIPDELLHSVQAGNVTFLCGAGVSKRASLPLFDELTRKVYERLGEDSSSEPAERIAIEKREFDRALRSLEKRTHSPGTVSRVRAAVAQLLAAPSGPYVDHEALLDLSRDREGRIRILTTNFDTLFERAASANSGLKVASCAGKSIPHAGRERDFGIFHLHGRIADEYLALESTDLILTSADFGDAYLRDGWASQYLEDRMRVGTMVLVGYGADDSALRLLLEALDADRERFTDLKDIYAMEVATKVSASLWKAKGVKPIEFSGFDEIYQTLREWARFQRNPHEYRMERMRAILASNSAERR